MITRPPPLTALRAFDAAARHMSFALAAAELNVTPAALSFQIKSLEEHLGTPLFRRLNRAVELTEAGRALAPEAQAGFTALAAGWRAAQRANNNNTLTVTAGPAFTAKWLAPRLFDFAQTHPDIELRFSASLKIIDFDLDEIDVAIRFGLGQDKDVYSDPLIHEWMTPMMSPDLAKRFPTPASLATAPLIHDDSVAFFKSPGDWPAWCRAEGLSLDTSHGSRFSQGDHALDAAITGAGVVLGRISLATQALETGQLVAPFQTGLVTDAQFRFICPVGHESRPKVAAFHRWIKKHVANATRFEEGRRMIDATTLPK
ncbi:MAG: transcriptional regulator GcvA [Sulfitobacter sp.]|nr:transcriptional regulator GcvA [Sulfitobacter sp.]